MHDTWITDEEEAEIIDRMKNPVRKEIPTIINELEMIGEICSSYRTHPE